jgi:hypothetical protein
MRREFRFYRCRNRIKLDGRAHDGKTVPVLEKKEKKRNEPAAVRLQRRKAELKGRLGVLQARLVIIRCFKGSRPTKYSRNSSVCLPVACFPPAGRPIRSGGAHHPLAR